MLGVAPRVECASDLSQLLAFLVRPLHIKLHMQVSHLFYHDIIV